MYNVQISTNFVQYSPHKQKYENIQITVDETILKSIWMRFARLTDITHTPTTKKQHHK